MAIEDSVPLMQIINCLNIAIHLKRCRNSTIQSAILKGDNAMNNKKSLHDAYK